MLSELLEPIEKSTVVRVPAYTRRDGTRVDGYTYTIFAGADADLKAMTAEAVGREGHGGPTVHAISNVRHGGASPEQRARVAALLRARAPGKHSSVELLRELAGAIEGRRQPTAERARRHADPHVRAPHPPAGGHEARSGGVFHPHVASDPRPRGAGSSIGYVPRPAPDELGDAIQAMRESGHGDFMRELAAVLDPGWSGSAAYRDAVVDAALDRGIDVP